MPQLAHGRPKKPNKKPDVALRNLFWNKIPDTKVGKRARRMAGGGGGTKVFGYCHPGVDGGAPFLRGGSNILSHP